MSDLLAARSQMALSLAFHMIFAIIGIGMPLLMVIAERLWLRTGERVYLVLAKRWCKGTAIMFAVGAVSGTVLSFELGLLWPKFMAFAGPVIGMPFSLEGLAFFIEAIFLGIYLYGWDRISPKAHWWTGVVVLVSGALSGIFVVTANAWMNCPTGFEMVDGQIVNIQPFRAMFNPAAFSQTLHMTLASFMTIGFAVAGVHAWLMLKDPDNLFHRRAIAISLTVGAIFGILQPISGDISAKYVAKYQPVKFAAMEAHWETQRGAPIHIGGWPDEEKEETRYAIKIPYMLSILAFMDPNAEVKGLKDFPRDVRPPVAIVHIAFQIMVGIGTFMMVVGLIGGWLAWRHKKLPDMRWYLWLLAITGPLGFIAVEAGWTVTEVGRQPWIIYNIMRTSEAVTPMPKLSITFIAFTCLYICLSIVVFQLMRYHVIDSPKIPVAKEDDNVAS